MSKRKVESVELSEITDRNAIVMVSGTEDGRKKYFGIDILSVLGNIAYGDAWASEQVKRGVNRYKSDNELSTRVARIPLRGLLEPGDITIELTKDDPSMPEAEWESFPVACDELELVTRGE